MQDSSLGLLGLFISAFISSTIAPGGSEAVLAYQVNSQQHTVEQLVALATIGNTLGALTTWWLGGWATQKYPADTLLAKNHQQALITVRRWGYWSLLFSWLPVVGDGLCFAGGWLKLAFIPSLLAILIGKLLRYIAVAYAFI